MRYVTPTFLGLAILGSAILSGCSEGIKTVPVYGNVTFAGREPPKVCYLDFQPVKVEGVSRPSTTKCEPDGSYAVKAFEHSRGLIPGTYRVRLTYCDLKPGANPALEANWRESKFDAGEVVVDASSRGVEHNIEVSPKPGQTGKK
jgi:hypothetical protein